ncbi:MAG: IclR family transcriptional regulator [Candidatus Sumerlaeia bacterium]
MLARAFLILDLVSRQADGISFSELQRACGDLAATTLSRQLKSLVSEGMVEKSADSGLYYPGSAFIGLARRLLLQMPRGQIIQPVVDALANETGDSAAYFDLDGDNMRLLAKNEQSHGYHYRELHYCWGPLIRDPYGLACLAWMDDVEAHIDGGLQRDRQIDMSREAILAKTEDCRRRGWVAMVRAMRSRVLRMTTPVFMGSSEKPLGAIGITSLQAEPDADDMEAMVEAVLRAGREASQLFPCSENEQ